MDLLVTACTATYFLGAVSFYFHTAAILMLTESRYREAYLRWQTVLWPYYTVSMVLAIMFSDEDDEDEE